MGARVGAVERFRASKGADAPGPLNETSALAKSLLAPVPTKSRPRVPHAIGTRARLATVKSTLELACGRKGALTTHLPKHCSATHASALAAPETRPDPFESNTRTHVTVASGARFRMTEAAYVPWPLSSPSELSKRLREAASVLDSPRKRKGGASRV